MSQSPVYRKHPKEYVCEKYSVHIVGSRYIKDLFNPWCATEAKRKVIPMPNCAHIPWTRMKEWRYSSIIFDLGTRWRRVVNLITLLLYRQGNSPWRYSIGRWVGPRASLDAVKKKKISCPCWDLNPSSSVIQPQPSYYAIWAIPALCFNSITYTYNEPCIHTLY
jgi:hypothetical protein